MPDDTFLSKTDYFSAIDAICLIVQFIHGSSRGVNFDPSTDEWVVLGYVITQTGQIKN